MTTVVQMTRVLADRHRPPSAAAGPSVAEPSADVPWRIRAFAADDIPAWLALRERTFARERVGVRAWSPADFDREFTLRSWWSPGRMFVAEPVPADLTRRLVGAITLGQRGGPEGRPVIHWLLVDPRTRRQGLGRALLAAAESLAVELGHQQIWLETHSAWAEAMQFYTAMGYRPTRDVESA